MSIGWKLLFKFFLFIGVKGKGYGIFYEEVVGVFSLLLE